MAPGRGTNLYQGPETRFPLAGFQALVVYSPEPMWLSMPPTLSPVPSPHRTPPAPVLAGDLTDFQVNELGVGGVGPYPQGAVAHAPEPSLAPSSATHTSPPHHQLSPEGPHKASQPRGMRGGPGSPSKGPAEPRLKPTGPGGSEPPECGQTSQVGLHPWAPT